MALRFAVCLEEDVPPGEMKVFRVVGVDTPILVANVDGRLHATSALCPHYDEVSLADAQRVGTWVICPGHGYELDLATGRCRHDPRLSLQRYKVTVADGTVFVDLA
jgi:nitrite reductase/ring-hydroxylating ferredoxin subunit